MIYFRVLKARFKNFQQKNILKNKLKNFKSLKNKI